MERQITLKNKKVRYILKKSKRARNVRLAIGNSGLVTLTVPHYISDVVAERFIHQKANWLLEKLEAFKLLPGIPKLRFTRRDYLKYKEEARSLVIERLAYLNQWYGFRFNRIAIRNQKTCWGSCSERGNLNFNYKILFLPEYMRDYVLVHELCHLEEFNHSKRFWNLVVKTVPHYKKVRGELNSLKL